MTQVRAALEERGETYMPGIRGVSQRSSVEAYKNTNARGFNQMLDPWRMTSDRWRRECWPAGPDRRAARACPLPCSGPLAGLGYRAPLTWPPCCGWPRTNRGVSRNEVSDEY